MLPCLAVPFADPRPSGPRDRDPTAHTNLDVPTTSSYLFLLAFLSPLTGDRQQAYLPFPCSVPPACARARSPCGPPSRDLLSPSLPSSLSCRRLRQVPRSRSGVLGGRGRSLPPYARCPGLLRALRRRRAPPARYVHHPLVSHSCCANPSTPNPRLLFVFGSGLITSVYACIMPTSFDCFCEKKNYLGPPLVVHPL